ncbi:phosphatase PAP2 family protein [Flavisolibacter ginsenosidimutans]|uniref:Inositol phosphorylceramide synthase n=1 Tax=Flavisolibacter ginsenosidimutans TaxID=661481 RepID=A0A5B8UFJ8_9BACT|nr:phosphatase PAP2 family protein [Flavisolibacter ginsenosidimutans]QEC55451.1 inositol phosphorylceramide synthase [Flavisolibacter ginsenosidimutans]
MTSCDTEKETEVLKKAKARQHGDSLFDAHSVKTAFVLTASYLIVSAILIGFKTEQVILVALFNACYFAGRPTRRFILGFSVFIVYWIVFDYMKAFPNYKFNTVHIQDLYQAEKSLFSFSSQGKMITPNEFFAQNTSSFFDLLSGIFYLCWIPLPLAFAGVLFFKNRSLFFQFALTFFLVNIIGFIGYYLYPAAPPWYVAQHGFDFISSTPGNTAGLGRFDALVGAGVFKSIYAKSSNVFAAMPSLHASYILIVLFYGLKGKFGTWNILFALVMIGIWFAAVYSSHHYVLDVLAGVGCAIVGIALFQWWIKTKTGRAVLQKLVRMVTI